jgi:two-component sensor histidine kinase
VTALGIVAAELVTNCYDHAFPNGNGSIAVSLGRASEDDGIATLTIRDNGTGFTPVAKSKRQGVGLVLRLIEQVRGTAVVDADQGTAWIIRFPITYPASA